MFRNPIVLVQLMYVTYIWDTDFVNLINKIYLSLVLLYPEQLTPKSWIIECLTVLISCFPWTWKNYSYFVFATASAFQQALNVHPLNVSLKKKDTATEGFLFLSLHTWDPPRAYKDVCYVFSGSTNHHVISFFHI